MENGRKNRFVEQPQTIEFVASPSGGWSTAFRPMTCRLAFRSGFHRPLRIAHCTLTRGEKDWGKTSLQDNWQCGIGNGQCSYPNLTPLALRRKGLADEPLPPEGGAPNTRGTPNTFSRRKSCVPCF